MCYKNNLQLNIIKKDLIAGYHGVGGPVTVMKPRYDPEIRDPLFRAARSMGYKVVDPNGKRQTGTARNIISQRISSVKHIFCKYIFKHFLTL